MEIQEHKNLIRYRLCLKEADNMLNDIIGGVNNSTIQLSIVQLGTELYNKMFFTEEAGDEYENR